MREANRLGIPVIAIADTNADPDNLTIPIAGNDDAIRSVSLITGVIAEEIEKARRERPELGEGGEEQGATTYSTDVGEAKAAAGSKKKRPKRRPRPELIRRRRHATDEEVASPANAEASATVEAESNEAGDVSVEETVEETVAVTPSSETPAAPEADSSTDGGDAAAVEEEREDGGSP